MRVVVTTDDRIGPALAGPGLRAVELARALGAAGHEVAVVGGAGSGTPPGGPETTAHWPRGWAEAVVAPVWSVPPRALLGRARLIADGVNPLLAELRAMPPSPRVRRRLRTAGARLPLVLAGADALLVAGDAQAGWWRARLGGRRIPLVELPFGVPEGPPPPEREEIPGVPPDWQVVLWWGGVWPWLDLETLLAARARLGDTPVSVVVPTAARPGSDSPGLSPEALAAAAARHRLEPPAVVGLERWVPYDVRHRLLNRAAVVAVLDRGGDEAELAFRTRALDAVWAAVPLLLGERGEVARLAGEHGWGLLVPAGDDEAVAAALAELLGESAQARCRRALAAARDDWTWPRLVAPLVELLPRLPVVARRRSPAPLLAAVATLVGLHRAGGRR